MKFLKLQSLRKKIIPVLIFTAGIFTDGCLDPYDPSATQADLKYLVINGFVDNATGTCLIKLTRTVPLKEFLSIPTETGADVRLEDESGTVYPMDEILEGQYFVSGLSFTDGDRVRLKITTSANVEYASDLVPVLSTPPIDSVTWSADRQGLTMKLSTHDDTDKIHYYLWSYEDTWTYTAAYETRVTLDGLAVVYSDEYNYICWLSSKSKAILLGASPPDEKEVNRISEQAVFIIPWDSPKLQIRYSLLMKQRAITKEAYNYYQLLKKNTENLGTLFDPLPSQPGGNIRCTSNPGELALGFFTASSVQDVRIFVNFNEFERPEGTRPTTGYEGCDLIDVLFASQWESLWPVGTTLPIKPNVGTYKYCVDCRLFGGTTTRPDFWTY